MVTLKQQLFGYDADGKELYYAEIVGVHSDSKPTTGLVSGSKFTEADTGKTFVFDGISTTKAWNEIVVATEEVASS